jgi:Ca2+-binding RTX toxin-like protein
LDFSSGQFTTASANMGLATLTASADHSHVLVETFGLASYLYVSGTGFVAQSVPPPSDPYAGAALPPGGSGIQAVSRDGSLYVQGQTLNVYDSSLHLLTSLTASYPYLGSAQGLAFSPDGQKLYVATAESVVVFSTTTWDAIGAYSIGDSTAIAHDSVGGTDVGFADILQASADGHHLSVIGSHGVQLIDLTLANFQSTTGGDTISGAGTLYGLAGNDDLSGVGSTTWMYGGSGDDTYHITSYYDHAWELPNQGHDTVHSTIGGYTLEGNIEDLVLDGSSNINGFGNELGNLIVGNTGNNQLGGAAGNDHIQGGAGDDTLDGGAGDDVLDGGDGKDTATYLSAQVGVTVNLSQTGPQNTGMGSDTLISIENLQGSWLNDHLTGDAGSNRLEGFSGDDILTGGLGADTLVGGDGSDTFIDTAAGLNGDTLADISNIDKIIITDANIGNFTYSLVGNVLNYTGGSLTL